VTAATAARSLSRQTFASLRNPNYRRFFAGQAISLIGTWMQRIAQSWLVLEITGSGTAIGGVVAMQTLPMLVLGTYGGVVADRVDKRRLMISLQSGMGVLALVLGMLTITDVVQLWHVYVLALLLGLINCFENPARQSFVLELVGAEHVRNAVSLNSVLANGARIVGPAVAGAIITAGGLGVCFLLNAVSFAAVVASLMVLDLALLQPSPPTAAAKGQLREGLAYVWRTPTLCISVLMLALVGCLTMEFQVILPIVAKDTFGGDAQTYGFLMTAMGLGAVVGGLFVAARGSTGVRSLIRSALFFGVAVLAAALAPYLWVELAVLTLVGAASIGFMARGNSTLQLESAPHMRGRVMGLYAVALLGSTPIGGPVAGAIGEHFGGRVAMFVGAAACFVAAAMGLALLRRWGATARVARVSDEEPLDDEAIASKAS
jgi:MFS family permease